MCLSVGHTCELCKHGLTDPDVIWGQTRVDPVNQVLDRCAHWRHMANAIEGSVQQQHCRLLLPLLYQLVVLCSEFGDDSDDDSYHGDDREDREKWKRRKFILNEFRRRNRVSIYIFETRIFTLITPAGFCTGNQCQSFMLVN